MFDPLEAVKSEIGDIEKRVRLAVEIAILRQSARFMLFRLPMLDPARKDSYQAAITALGE